MEENPIDRLRPLLRAYMDNAISEAEFDELVQLIQETAEEETLALAIDEIWHASAQKTPLSINSERIYDQILADPRIAPPKYASKRKLIQSLWPFIAGAAAFVCLGIFLYVQQKPTDRRVTHTDITSNLSKSIVPGRKKAILTLGNGKQIALDTTSEKALSQQLGTTIKKEQGKLSYINEVTSIQHTSVAQNTISTPYGSEFELTLPDGTNVWLNAGSSLTYPTRFSKHQRSVQLLGEAYFDVAKSKNQPFMVDANGTHIKVLGTQFNVRAYQDEANIKTTLVSGSLLVKSKKIKPGQQAITFSQSENINVHDIDIEEATAWRKGYFFFADEELTTVMNTLARWYNIEVKYSGNLRGKTFGGTISRYEDFHQLLKAIELTGSVHFQVKERRVMVSP
ncbi:FecR domain-containing protein [Olivibacter domesticus]|uniref:FecR family protein n=1 Tax=Olivibacter domesticus TaxID=407022 RepID=A0A1H7US89_OLID1|nr:FecR domain-containing protein [Olivibacter domesticus]SEL99538.1 FecR family protein [Olivibacter domesticus]